MLNARVSWIPVQFPQDGCGVLSLSSFCHNPCSSIQSCLKTFYLCLRQTREKAVAVVKLGQNQGDGYGICTFVVYVRTHLTEGSYVEERRLHYITWMRPAVQLQGTEQSPRQPQGSWQHQKKEWKHRPQSDSPPEQSLATSSVCV